MRMAVIKGFGAAVVSGVLLWLIGSLGAEQSIFSWAYTILRAIAWVFIPVFFWGIAYGIRGLVVGSRVHYLFAGGLVYRRRSGLRAAGWPEISHLKTVYSRRKQGEEGKVLGYQVHTTDGSSYAIPLLLKDGRDAFIDGVIACLRQHDRPIR
jgi:hypothetical protein